MQVLSPDVLQRALALCVDPLDELDLEPVHDPLSEFAPAKDECEKPVIVVVPPLRADLFTELRVLNLAQCGLPPASPALGALQLAAASLRELTLEHATVAWPTVMALVGPELKVLNLGWCSCLVRAQPHTNTEAVVELARVCGGSLHRLSLSGAKAREEVLLLIVLELFHQLTDLELDAIVQDVSKRDPFQEASRYLAPSPPPFDEYEDETGMAEAVQKTSPSTADLFSAPRPNLTSLSVISWASSQDVLSHVAERCPRLARLCAQGAHRVDDDLVCLLATSCRLTALNASETGVTELGLQTLREAATPLVELDLSWCDQVEDTSSLRLLFAAQSHLQKVTLKCLDSVDVSALTELSRHPLRELDVSRCSRLSAAFLATTVSPTCQLTRLTLSWVNDVGNDHLVRIVHCCARLERLDVEGCKRVSDEGLDEARLSNCVPPSLTFLNLFYVDLVTVAAIERLLDNPWCRRLCVRDYHGNLHRKETRAAHS